MYSQAEKKIYERFPISCYSEPLGDENSLESTSSK